MLSFALQDILGAFVAFFVFSCVLLFPGYVVGNLIDLFAFKRRQIITRYLISIVLSFAIIPILAYLLALFISFFAVKVVLGILFLLYACIVISEILGDRAGSLPLSRMGYYQKLSFFALGWIPFSILSLVDIQWNGRLYNTIVSLDFATRVTLVNAITRTGIPPVNPSYFPGHPEFISSLYYFWYVICSVVDQIGGDLVDARTALIAGDAWCGLALMAIVALYLKLRNQLNGEAAWKKGVFGISLLLVSGLDFVPALINMIVTRVSLGFAWPAGDIEHWNEQITAWAGSLLWVPHHVAAMIACLTGFLVLYYNHQSKGYKKILIMVVAGLAFASAVGLSTWVAITFSIFLAVWALFLLRQRRERSLGFLLIFVGFIALFFSFPFLLGILKAGTGGEGLPIIFEVRRFLPVVPFVDGFSIIAKNTVHFLFLPINYLMELGFFLIVGLLWLQKYRNKEWMNNPIYLPELLMLSVVMFVCTFARSAIVDSNDIGWRGWLLGQFVLLVWAADFQNVFPFLGIGQRYEKVISDPQKAKVNRYLVVLLLAGFVTSVVDVSLLRFWSPLIDLGVAGFPNNLSPDMQLGKRTFAARLAHEFIRDELPAEIVIQQNPLNGIDRPSGLYGTRQVAISANAPYNVPLSVLEENTNQISKIFTLDKISTWAKIDSLCHDYFIDVIITNDLDPLWSSLPILYHYRDALYANQYYAVLACGRFAEVLP